MSWRLTIPRDIRLISDNPAYVIEGDGPAPVAEILGVPVPGDPADTQPGDGPPAGDPYAPQPGEDTSPFVFPTDGPRHQTRDFDRNYPLARTLPGSDYYAVESGAGNPAILSHVNAGIIAPGGLTDYGSDRPKAVGGLRLWVRAVAGESMTGQPIPPAPPHLIRRALAKGRL